MHDCSTVRGRATLPAADKRLGREMQGGACRVSIPPVSHIKSIPKEWGCGLREGKHAVYPFFVFHSPKATSTTALTAAGSAFLEGATSSSRRPRCRSHSPAACAYTLKRVAASSSEELGEGQTPRTMLLPHPAMALDGPWPQSSARR